MSYAQTDDPRIRRRLWFTMHVLVYCVVALLQVLVWPAQPLLLAAQSALLVTMSLHMYELYVAGFDALTPEPVPVNVKSGEPQQVKADTDHVDDSFWFRWHDV